MDYLRPRARIREVWYGRGGHDNEHQWAGCLEAMPHARVIAPGFGSSDCRCRTHLIYFPEPPQLATFKRHQPKKIGAARPSIYRLTEEIREAMPE
jgi:Uri superfamily endonuclease